MKRFSALFQFILGFFLGVSILVGGTAALAYVVFSRLSTSPPKPIFAEEQPKKTETSQAKPVATAQSPTPEVKKPSPPTEVKAKPSEPQKTEAKKEPADALPNGAYKAKVTWSEGLSLRADSTTESERVGGVAYNYELTVINTSNDGQWHKVRLAEGQEGWVKAGNLQKIE